MGIAISAALLWWVLRDVDLGDVVSEMGRADPLWLILATFVATTTMVVRAFRWKPILAPVVATRFGSRFSSVMIGFMANNLIPARVGEFVRAYALARQEPVGMPGAFGSLVVARIFDGLTVVGLLAVAVAWPSFPEVGDAGSLVSRMATLGLVAPLALVAVLVAMVRSPVRAVAWAERLARATLPRSFCRPIVDALEAFLSGLKVLKNPRLLVEISAWSIGLWLYNSLGFWLAFKAFGIDVPFIGAMFLQSIISLVVAVPSAPGFFGLYQWAATVGLEGVWGVDPTPAAAFAIGFHLAGFIPVTLIGLWYASRIGLSWGEVGGSEDIVETAVEDDVALRGGPAADRDPRG
ncbi:MAG: lysylphosphatidylglycerol synthase transmembrane domain-containing protein [Gemmatimonadota bacterium]